MNIQKLLEYQKKDFEIIKLERKMESNEDKKIFTNMLTHVKDAQNKSANLEKEAESIIEEYESYVKTYNENKQKIEMLEKKNFEKLSEAELEDLATAIVNISNNLVYLEKKIKSEAEKINNVINSFEQAKKQYNIAKDKYKMHKDRFEKETATFAPQIQKIQDELKVLEKGIEPALLTKYKSRRQDKNFPIFVAVQNKSCGGCMMELPSAALEKMKRDGGILECDNCHRFMFNQD